MDKFSFLHNPKTYTLSSMILGYILIGNLSSAEQNALGNYLITIGQILEENSANVDFYDPMIPEYKYKNKVHTGIKNIDEKIIALYDLVIITAAHSAFDYEMISKNAKAIFDTRNAMKNIKNRNNIELL